MSGVEFRSSLPPGPVMVDVAGLALSPHEQARIAHPLVGGVILFARNFSDRAQLEALTAQIRAARNGPVLIAVDHEGGRVQRFRDDGFTHIPAMRALGQAWDGEGDVVGESDAFLAQRLATAAGYVLAAELRACGVDLSFTPVLDLDYGGSRVIGNRALHRDPAIVASLARALNHGLLLAGMANCGKHFPGHGYVEGDSHHEMPVDDRNLETILAEDGAPYSWLGDAVVPSVMPAHVVYSQVDIQPAGFSRRWIQEILRQRLGYDGVVFSDDLTMEAATAVGDILARAQAALSAGCDMVLVCNRPDLADDLLARLQAPVDAVSAARIQRLLPQSTALRWDALQQQPLYRESRLLVDTLAGYPAARAAV